jgi:two-component system cell cycle response regulator DivK
LSGSTVLVVEDNELNLELVEYLLEEAGFEIRRAMDADQARSELEQGAPDVILMDMQLPGTDGLTLVAEIRRNEAMSKVPIIALTAHAMRGDRERFLQGGCDGYIAKPIDVGKFVDQVREILDCSEK